MNCEFEFSEGDRICAERGSAMLSMALVLLLLVLAGFAGIETFVFDEEVQRKTSFVAYETGAVAPVQATMTARVNIGYAWIDSAILYWARDKFGKAYIAQSSNLDNPPGICLATFTLDDTCSTAGLHLAYDENGNDCSGSVTTQVENEALELAQDLNCAHQHIATLAERLGGSMDHEHMKSFVAYAAGAGGSFVWLGAGNGGPGGVNNTDPDSIDYGRVISSNGTIENKSDKTPGSHGDICVTHPEVCGKGDVTPPDNKGDLTPPGGTSDIVLDILDNWMPNGDGTFTDPGTGRVFDTNLEELFNPADGQTYTLDPDSDLFRSPTGDVLDYDDLGFEPIVSEPEPDLVPVGGDPILTIPDLVNAIESSSDWTALDPTRYETSDGQFVFNSADGSLMRVADAMLFNSILDPDGLKFSNGNETIDIEQLGLGGCPPGSTWDAYLERCI